jgi:glycine/D-amino acid oxidase-like deaminating enzyme
MAARATSDVEHDVIICGGGIVAASIAYHLTLRGAWGDAAVTSTAAWGHPLTHTPVYGLSGTCRREAARG